MTIPRHRIFNNLASRLGLYNGLLFQTQSHLKDIINIKKNWPKNKTGFFLGTHLTFRNYLIGRHEFIHTYEVNRKNISKTVDTFNIQFANFCIAQCFEAFETFLKDVIALKIYKSQKLPLKIAKKIKGKSILQCRKNIEQACRQKNKYNKKLFALIKALSMPSSTQLDLLQKQLGEWYIVLTEIRHCIVHSNSHLKAAVTTNWSSYQNKILKTFLTKENKGGIITINCSPNYRTIIETIAMHGQLIYDRLDITN